MKKSKALRIKDRWDKQPIVKASSKARVWKDKRGE